jgi:hypothetical protein
VQNPSALRQVVIGVIIIGIAVVAFGIYQVLSATQRYNQLDAIPIQNLLDTAKENPTNAETIVLLDKQKRDTLIQRSQSLIFIGMGAVILGLGAFMFARLPSSQQTPPSSSSTQPM